MKRAQPAKSANKTPRRLPGKLNRELARTWVITVINPVVESLRREKVWLGPKNWSWRYSTGGFEHLWPVASYVDPAYSDNLAEFRGWYPEVAQAIDRHDALLMQLATACRKTLEHLLDSEDFRRVLEDADAAARNRGINIEEARGAVPADDWPRLMAQYLINNIGLLPEYYTTAGYWKVAGSTVLGIKNDEAWREEFTPLERIGGRLLRATEQAEVTIVSIRQRYTRQFGLPPVPLPVQT
jgi:hypothetical protein